MTEPGSSLGHQPGQKWVFDEHVVAVFDDMLRRSIPQHDVMRSVVFEFGDPFIRPGTDVVDLGCARGEALAPFIDRHGALCRYVGVEVSRPMLEAARTRFAGWDVPSEGTGSQPIVRLVELDLRERYPAANASLTLCVLTLQFVPIEYRQRVVANAFAHTAAGGALILVEKVLGATARLNDLLVDRYYATKRAAGYSQDEIDRKRFALEGVLVPQTAAWNEALLRAEGFNQVECIWRWSNFAAWLAIRE